MKIQDAIRFAVYEENGDQSLTPTGVAFLISLPDEILMKENESVADAFKRWISTNKRSICKLEKARVCDTMPIGD